MAGLLTGDRITIIVSYHGVQVDTFSSYKDAVELLLRRLTPEQLTITQETIRKRKRALKEGHEVVVYSDEDFIRK